VKKSIIKTLPTALYLNLRWWDFKINKPDSFKKVQALRKRETQQWSSYKPFDDKQAIFVHIPKCAGISINKSLFGNLAGGHTTLEQYVNIFEPKLFQSYFKFTFVRNPWDRVVSAYCFLNKGGFNQWDKDFYEKELAPYQNFSDFVKNWLTHENIFKHHHFKPQYTYIVDKYHKVSVDYIGYFETIEQDYQYIANKMGVNTLLEKKNIVLRDDYKSFYNQETKDIVADIYQEDIKLFNYSFDKVNAYSRTFPFKDLQSQRF
jgi:hypothetical protein